MSHSLIVRPCSKDNDLWELVQSLEYRGHTDTWRIPQGYVTDFASVPRILWPLFPPYGKHTIAAVVHDYLYDHKPHIAYKNSDGSWSPRRITRSDADGVFRRIMKERGVGFTRRWLMWAGVRIGGWYGWMG